MGHNDGWLGGPEHAGVLANGELLAREGLHRIALGPPIAVAHPRKIDRRDIETARQERGDETPPISMRGVAMNEQQPWTRLIAPTQIMNARTLHRDETAFGLRSHRLFKPLRCGRWRAIKRSQGRFQIGKIDFRDAGQRPGNVIGHRGVFRGAANLKMPVPVSTMRSSTQMRPREV